jgi:hypothetical protein
MEIFLAWSGERSLELARILDKNLRSIDGRLETWMAPSDIRTGEAWRHQVQHALDSARAVICCVTPENYHKAWINFEAGVGAGKLNRGPFCVSLVGKIGDEAPLSQYQFTPCSQEGIRRLIDDLRSVLSDRSETSSDWHSKLEKCWPAMSI